MKAEEYLNLFDPIIEGLITTEPYDQESFVTYTKLNKSRQKRWQKKGELNESLKLVLDGIKASQKWTLITEPWCGDAAHSVPFIIKAAAHSPLIELDIQLRDSPPYLIEDYLTNGGKSIPKLIVKDAQNNDLFNWGPRPVECQKLMLESKDLGLSAANQKELIQQWYNQDKGESIQKELTNLLKMNNS